MGSTESTLPAMEEEESVIERIARRRRRATTIATEGVAEEIQNHAANTANDDLQLATATATASAATAAREQETATGRRRRRFTDTDVTQQRQRGLRPDTIDDPWWWEIENEDLILDQAPSVTRLFSESEANVEHSVEPLVTVEREPEAARAVTREIQAVQQESSEPAPSKQRNEEENKLQVRSDAGAAARTSVSPKREQTLDEFREELRKKRLARQSAVQDLRDELSTLRQELAAEQELTRRLRKEKDGSSAGTGTGTDNRAEAAESGADADTNAAPSPDADDEDPMSRGRHANIELANAQLALQLANSENISLRAELGAVRKQVSTLKDVVLCCKQMLQVKEDQCSQLKAKLNDIESTMGEQEMRIMSDNLRQEYEKQLENIRQLRQLYEERQRVASAEYENLQRLISIKKDEVTAAQEKIKSMEQRTEELVAEVESLNNELALMKEECNEHKFEKKTLKEEMGAINTLFSQMVVGFNGGNNLDIDRLTTMLEENRTLLNDMATKELNCSDGATLPKLLFELVEQASVSSKTSGTSTPMFTPAASDSEGDDTPDTVDAPEAPEGTQSAAAGPKQQEEDPERTPNEVIAETRETEGTDEADCVLGAASIHIDIPTITNNATATAANKTAKKISRRMHKPGRDAAAAGVAPLQLFDSQIASKVASTQEIIGNLPKVWKVLTELLSHHQIVQVQLEEGEASCYKSVETPNGPKPELSVSKTYIKLKDLILEKKSLVKETSRLKMLNSHLDYRLNEQQKRLSAVSLELTKTWHLVGKMQRQHRQLHTQEQILRYQLQQKRRLLSELKDELEYCRRKWAAARAKNDESQEQCNDLRREFAQRKLDDAHNSAESGYSDSGPPSDEGEGDAELGDAHADAAAAAAVAGSSASSRGACTRRKLLKEMFEHTRKVKRMQSTSPGRALSQQEAEAGGVETVLRWNSAPPTCGWRPNADEDDEDTADGEGETARLLVASGHASRSRERQVRESDRDGAVSERPSGSRGGDESATRILRLEEQCKSLIQQVLETTENRERMEVQLCRFQDQIAPVQYAVPLQDLMNRRHMERMTRASSAPAAGTLTPREEEYTRKRSERLERLEEESRQLISRIKRTSDRGHYLRCSLDRIRRQPSREGSLESNTEEEERATKSQPPPEPEPEPEAGASAAAAAEVEAEAEEELKAEEQPQLQRSPLTDTEEAYTARRAARLQRLEEEGRQLLSTLSNSNARGEAFERRLDDLHGRFGPQEEVASDENSAATTNDSIEQRMENIERISTTRAERLRILEEEGKELLTRLTHTSQRGTQMINRIAEREQQRSARIAAANNNDEKASEPILPTAQNVACSSIVSQELNECVTVTTTASQLSANQGAVPKTSRPLLQLCASRPARRQPTPRTDSKEKEEESLEEMVKRLQELPFPTPSSEVDADESTESKDDSSPSESV